MSEKLTIDHPTSEDSSSNLVSDAETIISKASQVESTKVNFGLVSRNVTAMLLFMDGGPRNFQVC